MHSVFVYGTLKQGGSNHHLLGEAALLGKGETKLPYYMATTGGYPVVLKSKTVAPVRGEIYEVDDTVLKKLDWLEGHPDFFMREQISVEVGDSGVYHTCWMYFGPPDMYDRLPPVPVTSDNIYVWS